MPRSVGQRLSPSPTPPVRRWLPSATICCWPGAIWLPLWIRWWRPLSLINALIVAVGMRRQKEVGETYAQLEKIWDEYDVYEKNEENIV